MPKQKKDKGIWLGFWVHPTKWKQILGLFKIKRGSKKESAFIKEIRNCQVNGVYEWIEKRQSVQIRQLRDRLNIKHLEEQDVEKTSKG